MQMNSCIADIRIWATQNALKFNDAKTEILHFSSKFKTQPNAISLTVGDTIMQPTDHARNLGVIMDQHLTMNQHLKNICKSSMIAIRSIGQIRQYLTAPATKSLIHSFVTSRLDTCNSLLYGLPQYGIQHLQRIQNTAVRISNGCLSRKG
mgnify:CR=1 FL=1